MSTLTIGDRTIGDGHACYVVAEVGVNHNGRVHLAHDLVDVAADAGADAVKFQTFDVRFLVSEHAATAPYQNEKTGHATQREMLRALALPRTAWQELRGHALDQGLHFLSTPFDPASALLLAELGVPALKVPSGELTNTPFIREVARLGLPMFVSTGMGDLEEVSEAVEACADAPGLAIFHCVSAYPTPPNEANLRAVRTLEETFGVPAGWSDHTQGSVTAVAAVALGAALLEKHITLDRTMTGPDHAASEDPGDFRRYVRDVRLAEAALGDGIKRPQPSESANREAARRSWHMTRAMAAGEVVGRGDVEALRPETGLRPSVDVIGRRLLRSLDAGAPLGREDVDLGEAP